MKKTAKGLLRTLATRSVIAVIPVAMVSAYASNMLVPAPPRITEYAYQQVAEITVSPDTVGIAASPLYGQTKAQIDAQLDQMQALGVQNIRVFVPWGSIDFFGPSNPGSASWATLDVVMQAAKERNMGVLAEVNSTPPYAAANGNGSIFGSDTPDPAKFAAFMTKFVTAYGDVVSAYEIWNEPNSIQFSNPIDPAAYAALVKAAYQAIKPLDPTATVVAGAVGHVFTTGATMDPVDFIKAMIAADPTIGNYFDALSYHPYDETLPFSAGNVNPNGGGFSSDTAFNQVKDLMALFPTKKVWISEFGVPTYSYTFVDGNGVIQTVSVTQQQQEALIKDLINTWGTLSQAGPIFLYTGRDTATGSADPNANYGLYDQLGNPKLVVSDFLKQWFIDHPQNGTGPTNPGNPADALAAALQVLAQQIAQSIAQAISQAFAQTLGQQIATALVTAIANALAGLGQAPAATTAAPLALRVASVEAPAAATTAAKSAEVADTAPTGESKVPGTSEAAAVEGATPAAAEAATVTPTATAPVTEAAVPAAQPATATPQVTESTGTEPVAAEPVVTKTPVATTTESTTPEPAKPTAAASTTSETSTSAGVKGESDTPSKTGTGDGGQGRAPKAGGSDTPGSGKSGSDASGQTAGAGKSEPSARFGKDKGPNGFAGPESKTKSEAGSTVAAGAVTASAAQG